MKLLPRSRRRKRHSSMILEDPGQTAVPEPDQNPFQCKTTIQAVGYLNQVIEEAESRTQLVELIWCPSAFLLFIAATILLVFYMLAPSLDKLLPSVILLYFSATVNAAIRQFDSYRNKTEIRRRLGPAKRLLQSIAENTEQAHVNDPVSRSSTHFQTVLRDGRWVQIPNIALVPGDLIQLRDGMIAPCNVEVVSSTKSKKPKRVHRGDTLKIQNSSMAKSMPLNTSLSFFPLTNNTAEKAKQDNQTKIAGCNQKMVFRVLDCSLSEHLSKLVDKNGRIRPISTYVNQKNAVYARIHRITALGFIMAMVPIVFLLISKWSKLSREMTFILAHQPIVAILSCLGPSEVFFSFLVDAFGNGVLIQTDIDLKKVRHDDSAIGLGPSKLQNLRLFWKERRSTLYRIMSEVFGLGTALTRSMNPFEILGQITAVCALDKDGIVSEVFSAPEHVLIWDNGAPVVLDLITDHDLSNHITFG